MEASEIGLWDWNIKAKKIYYSPGWSKILGYNEKEFSDKLSFWKDKVHPNDKAEIIGNIIYH